MHQHRNTSSPVMSRRRFATLLGAGAGALTLGSPGAHAAAPTVVKTAKAGPNIYELVVSTTTNLLHVASVGARGQNEAAIIGLDLQTLEPRSTIKLGEDAAFGLGVNDRTGTLYCTDSQKGQVVVVDLRSGTVKGHISSGEPAHGREVVMDEAHDRAFVSIFGGRGKPSAIWVLDTNANAIATVISEGLEGGIAGLSYDPKGDRLFATALATNEIVEVSLSRKAGIRRFASGGEGPIDLVYEPQSNRVYCTNEKSGQLSVLDAASGQAVKVLNTGEGAIGLALSPDGGLAYVANRGAGTVSLVDTRALAVLGSVPTGTHPNTVAIDPRSGLAYVTNKGAMAPRGQPPVDDSNGDTVSMIRV